MDEKIRLKELLRQLKQENLDSFDELYLLTKKGVYFAIYTIIKDEEVVKDLMQETYIEFLNHKTKLKDDVDVYAFLVQIAKNKTINYWNKRKYESEFVSNNYKDSSYSRMETIDTGLLKIIQSTLNENEYMVFTLKVLGEYSFKEISKIKKIPIGTCTWLYQEARKKLIDKIGGIN